MEKIILQQQVHQTIYQGGIKILHQASDDVDAASPHQLFAVDLMASDKVSDESQESGNVKALFGLSTSLEQGNESVNTSDTVDDILHVLKSGQQRKVLSIVSEMALESKFCL